MTIEQAKQAVTRAEQDYQAAESAVRDAKAAESAVREQVAQAVYANKSVEDIDALKLRIPEAESRVRLAQLNLRRAQGALDHAKTVLGHMTTYKAHFTRVAEQAKRIAAIDAEISIIADGARKAIVAKLEERLAAMTAAGDALSHVPGPVRVAVDGCAPIEARSWAPVLDALANPACAGSPGMH